jgi:hypothetical protein
MSLTDDMAENVAMMMYSNPEERYSRKKQFKNRYSMRNKIAHHGYVLDQHQNWGDVWALKTDTVWSVLGILSRFDEIQKYGNKSSALREYFERKKLT